MMPRESYSGAVHVDFAEVLCKCQPHNSSHPIANAPRTLF
jgi:hypothetical protein